MCCGSNRSAMHVDSLICIVPLSPLTHCLEGNMAKKAKKAKAKKKKAKKKKY